MVYGLMVKFNERAAKNKRSDCKKGSSSTEKLRLKFCIICSYKLSFCSIVRYCLTHKFRVDFTHSWFLSDF